jgi:hypothetical protein
MTTRKSATQPAKQTTRKSKPNSTVEETAPVEPHLRSLELHEWLDEVRTHAELASNSGAPKGACLVPNARTGGNDCVRTDKVTCTTRLHGTWIGGPCGPS